jgi:hypothetical protein
MLGRKLLGEKVPPLSKKGMIDSATHDTTAI